MGFEQKPGDIRKSMEEGNVAHLRNAGKKGAEKTNDLRRIELAKDEVAKEINAARSKARALEEKNRMEAANEHLSPPPGPFD